MRCLLIFVTAAFLAASVTFPRIVGAEEGGNQIEIDSDSFAAIAFSPTMHTYSWAFNYEDRETAEEEAISANAGKDARAVGWVNNGFISLALGDNNTVWGTGVSAGGGSSTRVAERESLAECRKHSSGDAFIVLTLSSDGQLFLEKKRPSTPKKDGNQPELEPGGTITRNPDGSSVETRPDGTKIIKNVDGTVVVTKPDGTQIVTLADGSIVETKPDGTEIVTNVDGSSLETRADGTKITIDANGLSVETKPDGTKVVTQKEKPSPKMGIVLDKKIYQLVKGLEYSDQVATDFVDMVRPWKCDALYQALAQAAQDATHDKISADQYAQVEEDAINQLARTIREHIAYADHTLASNLKYLDLASVIQDKKAMCLGHTQVFYLLGNSLGLTTRAIDVLEHSEGQQTLAEGHVACVVDLHNGKTVQVDLGIKDCVSKAFTFTQEYNKTDNCCELGGKENRLKIHPRIQLLDGNGLLAVIYKDRGNVYGFSREFDKALFYYNKAIELNPRYASAYYNRGIVYFSSRQIDKALADYAKAIELDPKFADAYNNRGFVYYSVGQPNKAIADCTKAIEFNPQHAYAYNNRGIAYNALGQPNNAIPDFTKAIELIPKYDFAYNGRGNAYGALGQTEKAIADFTKAVEINPKYGYAYGNRGNAYRALGQTEKALSDYAKAIELDPKDASAYNNRATAYNALGQLEKALSDYAKAIELNPKNADAYHNRGVAYLGAGKLDEAISDFNRTIELNPSHAPAYAMRGLAKAKQGNTEEGKSDLHEAIRLNPKMENFVKKKAAEAHLDLATENRKSQ